MSEERQWKTVIKTWKVTSSDSSSQRLDVLLNEGWEPFSVTAFEPGSYGKTSFQDDQACAFVVWLRKEKYVTKDK